MHFGSVGTIGKYRRSVKSLPSGFGGSTPSTSTTISIVESMVINMKRILSLQDDRREDHVNNTYSMGR